MSEITTQELLKRFAKLNTKQQNKVYRQTFQKAANKLVKATRSNLKQVVKKITTKHTTKKGSTYSLSSGIKGKAWKKKDIGATVSILSDFRLKFFERGTNDRFVKTRKGVKLKKKAFRGKNTAKWFFKSAKAQKEKEIFNDIDKDLSANITKIFEKG